MVAVEPLPVDFPTEGGQLIDARNAFPTEGSATPIPAPPLTPGRPGWKYVWDWLQDGVEALWNLDRSSGTAGATLGPAAAGFTPQQIFLILNLANSVAAPAVTGVGSFINLLNDKMDNLGRWAQTNDYNRKLEASWESNTRYANDQALAGQIQNVYDVLRQNIADMGAQLEAQLGSLAGQIIPTVENWAVENIFNPLTDALGQVYETVEHDLHYYDARVRAEANAYTDAALAGLAGVTAGILPRLAALEQEAQDCTEPMCEVMGPKTDLGKLLKALDIAKWAALLALLDTMDIDALTQLARDLVSFGEGTAESWVRRIFGV